MPDDSKSRPSEAEKEAFLLSTIQPMGKYTLPYVVSLDVALSEKEGKHLGSGVRCILGGKRCVLTAEHVVREALSEYGHFLISAGYGYKPVRFDGRIIKDSAYDLAICFLPDDFPTDDAERGIAYWTEDRIDQSVESRRNDYLFLHGYPGERSKFNPIVRGISSKSFPFGGMEQLDGLPPSAMAFNFGLNYDPQNLRSTSGTSADMVDPHGVSGCGVWRINIHGRTMAAWKPEDSLLVGIQIEYHEDYKVILATEISKVFELLNSSGQKSIVG